MVRSQKLITHTWDKFFVTPWGLLVCLAILPTMAAAQKPVVQDGRLFDANPQVGGYGRYNSARPISPLIGGNPYASGNVRFGQALQSFSPISDPTAFRGALGSSALGSFRRDSISVADIGVGAGLNLPYARPYYDPSSTVGTSGFLRGQYGAPSSWTRPGQEQWNGSNQPGTGIVNPLDMRLDTTRTNSSGGLNAQISGLNPGGPSNQLTSTIFGVNPPRASLTGDNGTPPGLTAFRTNTTRTPDGQKPPRPGYETPAAPNAPRPLGSREPENTPTDLTRRHDAGPPRGTGLPSSVGEIVRRADAAERNQAVARGEKTLNVPSAGEGKLAPLKEPRRLDTSVLPGLDVFTDMQLALSLARNPAAGWFEDMQAALRENPTLAQKYQDAAATDAQHFLDKMLKTPIRSFVGQGESAVNNELVKAESLLEIGQYYDASARYDNAHLLDPANPLPLIGKGHALLAAGDYLTAALFLIRGLERFPELSRFNVDLQAFLGGGEVIDVRRADIMARLQQREDPKLRFLLGYLEYHTGHQESGLQNLEQAAKATEPGSLIARYPAMVRQEGKLPPPKLSLPDMPKPNRGAEKTPLEVPPAPAKPGALSPEPAHKNSAPTAPPAPLRLPPASQPKKTLDDPSERRPDLKLPPPEPMMTKDP